MLTYESLKRDVAQRIERVQAMMAELAAAASGSETVGVTPPGLR